MQKARKRDILAWGLIAAFAIGLVFNIGDEPHTLDTSVSYLAR